MRQLLTVLFALIIFTPSSAWSCFTTAPAVTEEDVTQVIPHPSVDVVIAVQGTIKSISAHGSTDIKPHSGFTVELEITKAYQGETVGDVISIQYSPCHNLPGKTGETIYAIAYPKSDGGGLYAPQFWQKKPQEADAQDAPAMRDGK